MKKQQHEELTLTPEEEAASDRVLDRLGAAGVIGQRFGLCENCGDPKTHKCQYRFCEPCLRIVGTYPTRADFDRLDKKRGARS